MYSSKILVVGSPASGKTTFLRNIDGIENTTPENTTKIIDFSINLKNHPIDNNRTLSMMIWDIKGDWQFHEDYSYCFRGAYGCLLFFDLTNYESFYNLNHWISFVRAHTNSNIPFFLIGNKADLEHSITVATVQELRKEFNIRKVFFTSQIEEEYNNLIFNELATNVFDYLMNNPYKNLYRKPIAPNEEALYHKFLEFSAICPICKNKNHIDYLRKFYSTHNPEKKKLRVRLLNLMRESEEFEEIYINKIRLGVPCCTCHTKFFR